MPLTPDLIDAAGRIRDLVRSPRQPAVADMDLSRAPPSQLHTPAGRESVLGHITGESLNLLPRPQRAGMDHFADINNDPYMTDSWKDVERANDSQDTYIKHRMKSSDWRNYNKKPTPKPSLDAKPASRKTR